MPNHFYSCTIKFKTLKPDARHTDTLEWGIHEQDTSQLIYASFDSRADKGVLQMDEAEQLDCRFFEDCTVTVLFLFGYISDYTRLVRYIFATRDWDRKNERF